MPKGIDGRLLWRRTLPLIACLLVALATVVLAAGCGNSGESGSGSATVASRRVVRVERVRQDRWTYARARFNEMCAGCHTLADAGARGGRYNLDHSDEIGVGESHVRGVIATGEPGMPGWRDVLSPREYEELVAYIVTVTKKTAGDDYWHRQIMLRSEGYPWTRADTERLEAYAHRLVQERIRRSRR
jgi:hypothetical protein